MKTKNIISGITIFAMTFVFSSCKKEDVTSEIDNETISNEAVSSFVEKSISAEEDAATLRSGPGFQSTCNWQQSLPECAIVTESGDEYPRTITIDYGTGCTNSEGLFKSGVVMINISDDMLNEGAIRTVTFLNYVINNTQIEGSRTTTNIGSNESGQPVFSRQVNSTITRNNNSFERTTNETVTWISGYETETCGDNIMSVTGTGTCTRANGATRTRTIVDALIIDHICGYITQGTVEITGPQGTGYMNFGNGTCDDIAIVTRPNGQTHEIHLHQQ